MSGDTTTDTMLPPSYQATYEELQAALAKIEAEIERLGGAEALLGQIQDHIRQALEDRSRRRDLLIAVLAAMDALKEALKALIEDGYPTAQPAVSMTIRLGDPVPKNPPPSPPQTE